MSQNHVTVVLTTYNRPTLVRDAIESVAEQPGRVTLLLMDDGCAPPVRDAIRCALADTGLLTDTIMVGDGEAEVANWARSARCLWWHGRDRSMAERKATIPYSLTINVALNTLLWSETAYIAYLCDDDYLYPEGLAHRADFLDAHPEVQVCYGRSRSVQYDAAGYNQWAQAANPSAGRACPWPMGERVLSPDRTSARTYFGGGTRDPQTGLDYVEEAVWLPHEPIWYGAPFRPDHNQVMHRAALLRGADPNVFPPHATRPGWREFWPEDTRWGVGDAGFFTRLKPHPFHPVDAFVVTKRYHALSDGVSMAEIRE